VVFIGLTSLVYGESLLSLQSAVNWSCISPRVIGLCFRSRPPWVGIKVRYWEPALLIETVKRPGDSVVDLFGAVIRPITEGASRVLISGVTGLDVAATSGTTTNSEITNTQFNEVHVYGNPFFNIFTTFTAFDCGGAPVPGQPYYLSELDSVEWRLGLTEILNPKSLLSASLGPICSVFSITGSGGLCMGSWGALYPRRGWLKHQSEVVGSAADAYRAVSIASLETLSGHVVLSSLWFRPNPDRDKMSLVYPVSSRCINIGENPALWESGKTSPNGKYAWVYWRYRECCLF